MMNGKQGITRAYGRTDSGGVLGSGVRAWTRRSVLMFAAVAALGLTAYAGGQPDEPPASAPVIRFAVVDVFIDSGTAALAAYQLELTAPGGAVKIVGIEGGEHPAFADPPYYDPAAMSQDRVIIAAFDTGDDLPTGNTRVARAHVQITGSADPDYAVTLTIAAAPNGEPIEASATATQGENS